jgi:hypothetical protein
VVPGVDEPCSPTQSSTAVLLDSTAQMEGHGGRAYLTAAPIGALGCGEGGEGRRSGADRVRQGGRGGAQVGDRRAGRPLSSSQQGGPGVRARACALCSTTGGEEQ